VVLTADQRRLLFRYDRDLPLDAHTTAVSEESGVRIERVQFGSTHGHRVPAVLYRPADPDMRPPVVVVGHGAGSSKDDPVMRPLFLHWAAEGIACVAIDAPFHGERTARLVDPTAILMRPFDGLHFGVQTAVDTMRAVDWVQTRLDLDAHRLGFAGFSMGSILGVQFVAMDERVRAAVFALGGAGLLHYFAGMAPPERRRDFDLVAEALDPLHYAPLIAPRPVLMVNGRHDSIIPAPLGHALFAALKEPRTALWYDGDHGDIPREHIHAMRQFFLQHLRPD
jgi:uncharacterized protein